MRFAVFISGYGSNLQAIIDAVKQNQIKAELALVVSSKKEAYGLKRAEQAGIKTLFVDPVEFANRQSYDRQVLIHLKEEKIDFIVLAGYMRILTPFFVKKYPKRIINIHPSLLPSFRGVTAIKDALTYGVKITGATVHFVDEKMDHGPIILQESIKIALEDTKETLEQKIHKLEHRILPKSIELFVDGRLKVRGRKVEILEKPQKTSTHNVELAKDIG